jgi:pimeloyl-ACP methyl ester carboxylesterase
MQFSASLTKENDVPGNPTIVLVHGAFGDASHWRHVIPRLHDKGYRVFAAQNPLTSLSDDVDRTSKTAAAQDGPVLLVGHAYGGAVITGAGLLPNVVGLIYLAGPALDEGESLKSLLGKWAPPPGFANVRQDEYGFQTIEPDKFHDTFCQDLQDETESLVWALSQRPTAARCFEEPSAKPAWRFKPSWYQISTDDRLIRAETEVWMAQRMNARETVRLKTSHASIATHPGEIVSFIQAAVDSLVGMRNT